VPKDARTQQPDLDYGPTGRVRDRSRGAEQRRTPQRDATERNRNIGTVGRASRTEMNYEVTNKRGTK